MDEFDLEELARHMGVPIKEVQAGLKGRETRYDSAAEDILSRHPRTIEEDIKDYRRFCPTGVTAPSILHNIAQKHFSKKFAQLLSAP